MRSSETTADSVSRAHYSDALSSLPRGRCLGSVPFDTSEWHSTLDMERAVEAYLSSKPLTEQVALARLMSAIETPVPKRTARTTEDVPWLRQPGAGYKLAQQWWAELNGGRQ